jgi:superfamily II DNA or RNA helicase
MKKEWESWHLHHLVRRARIFGIEKKYLDTLNKAAWYLTKEKNILPQLYINLEKSLQRLAQIKNFEKTCEDIGCPICKKVEQKYSEGSIEIEPYKLSVELYRWQKEAKKIWWENNGRGIVKVVTGAGKTIFAFSIISDMHNSIAYKDGGLKTVIVVPTSALLDQWLFGLTEQLNIPRDKIAIYYGRKKEDIKGKEFVIYVVNSARKYIEIHFDENFKGNDVFLIADECHRYGSKENSKIFNTNYSYTLGLSATPERYGDMGFEEKIVPNLGEIIYQYTYSDALKEGIIPPYKLIRIEVKLTRQEEYEYEEISDQIRKIRRKLLAKYPELRFVSERDFYKILGVLYDRTQDQVISSYTSLLNIRKGIIHTSVSKWEALKWIIVNENLRGEKVLIFHERIEEAEKIYEFLKKKNFDVGIYHANKNINERVESISNYRNGTIDILVSCKALDEGFDVPETNTGIIVTGTSSVRQWIQRMGRILRRMPGKEFSRIYVVFVDLVEKDVFQYDELKEFENEAMSVELISMNFR